MRDGTRKITAHHRGPGHGRRRDRPAGRVRLRADRRRRGQDPGPAARRPASARASARSSRCMGINLPTGMFGSASSMDPLDNRSSAWLAAVGVLLVFMGYRRPASDAGVRALGRVPGAGRAGNATDEAATGLGERDQHRPAHSRASTASSRGGTGATNMRARARSRRPRPEAGEFLAIRAAAIVGVPLAMIVLGPFIDPAAPTR